MTDIITRIGKWAGDGHTGLSSKCMLAVLSGNDIATLKNKNHPHDGSDISKCFALLDAVPEWKSDIDKMRAVSPQWNALIDNWDLLRSKLHSEVKDFNNPRWTAPLTYDMIQSILNSLKPKRQELSISLSESAR